MVPSTAIIFSFRKLLVTQIGVPPQKVFVKMLAAEMKNMSLKKCTRIPKQILQNMILKGATVEKLNGEDLYSVTDMVYGDEAWKVYCDWGESIVGDPRVGAVFAPSESVIDTSICPADDIGVAIMREANSIIAHYAPLRAIDFADGAVPFIGPPLRAPRAHSNVHHASIALSKLMEGIQNPPKEYKTIGSLTTGHYICTITQQWSNAGVDIELFKS
jgi:hypothetical protein